MNLFTTLTMRPFCTLHLWISVTAVFALPSNPLHAAPQKLETERGPQVAARLQPISRLSAAQRLKLAISLPLRNQLELDRFLRDLYDPTSPGFRQYLTPEQFTERFSPSSEDYQALLDFAKTNGLEVTTLHPNRLVLSVEGPAGTTEKAFHVHLNIYNHPAQSRTFFAPDTAPTVDLPFAVLAVEGLDNFSIPRPHHHIKPPVTIRSSPAIQREPKGSPSPGPERFSPGVPPAAAEPRGLRPLLDSQQQRTGLQNGTAVGRLSNDSPSPGGPRSAKRSEELGHPNSGGVGNSLGRGEGEPSFQLNRSGGAANEVSVKNKSHLGRGEGELSQIAANSMAMIKQPSGSPITSRGGSGPGGSYRGSDFRAAYVPGTPLTGAGQSVGLVQFDGYNPSDITNYITQAGLPAVPITNVPIDGGVTTPGNGNGEVCLDIEMVISMAPGISNIYVYEAPNPSPWVDVLSRMANDNLSKQLSCSWGGGGPDSAAEQIFKQMAAQGQSFFNASGDSDAFTTAIDFPSDSTNITQVGGTTLATTGPGGAFVSETVWNWGGGTGSSGGVSTFYSLPAYQLGIDMSQNGGSTTMRNVPDVALIADQVYVTYNNGSSGTFGGTSCAAPLWAAFTALVNQQAVAAGQPPVGFLNPAIYAIGRGPNYTAAFHDTTAGNNTSSGSPTHYFATSGYDLCTGWGTPAGTNLINLLAGPAIPVPVILFNSFNIAVESCTNGVIDSGETVTINFGLKNLGNTNTTSLMATLMNSGGVLPISGPQLYGSLPTNGPAVALPFTFVATGSCGSMSTATLQVQDGTNNLGAVSFSFRLGLVASNTVLAENFDNVSNYLDLPAGWTTSATDAQSPWVTTAYTSDTSPYAAWSPDPPNPGVNELDSPVIALPAIATPLSFRHYYNMESGFDGGVLDIRIGAGRWMDIINAGGSFQTGGYVTRLSSGYGNPLAGRQAWTGNSGGFITTAVNFPANALGQNIQLRWRCGSDSSISSLGWFVDTVSISSTTYACCVPAPLMMINSSTAAGAINLQWNAVPGRAYQVQFKSDLTANTWNSLGGAITATNSIITIADPATNAPQRFYRVILLP